MIGTSPVLPHVQPAKPSIEEDLRRRLGDLRLEKDSYDRYVDQTRAEITRRDKRARFFCKATDLAGNAVKPIAVASLIGMGFNAVYGLGLLGSIAVLAGAFWLRGNLYREVDRLQKAEGELQQLETWNRRVEGQIGPLEKQLQDIEWIKRAAQVSRTLHGDDGVRVEQDAVYIGGIRLDREDQGTSNTASS